jgi:cyanate permease
VPAGGAGLLLAVASLAAVGARLVLGAVADRRSDRQFGVVAAMMALGTVGYVLLAVGGTPLTVAGALVAYGLGYGWSGLFFFSVARLDPVGAGSASGVVLTGGFLGSLLGPLVVGGLAERWSYSAGWIACACAMVLAAFATLVVHRRQTRRVPAAL